MQPEITRLSDPITDTELQIFENELGAVLPSDYREFLLTHNCAKVKPNCFMMDDRKGYNEGYNSVRHLFGICNIGWCSLRDHQKEYAGERMPANLLPIGVDGDSSYVCLSIAGIDRGTVYFWDRHFEVFDREPDYSNVFFVAEWFTVFITGLKSCDELREAKLNRK
jgi:hypothetical protein